MLTECRREQVTHGKLIYTIKVITDSLILNSTDSIARLLGVILQICQWSHKCTCPLQHDSHQWNYWNDHGLCNVCRYDSFMTLCGIANYWKTSYTGLAFYVGP